MDAKKNKVGVVIAILLFTFLIESTFAKQERWYEKLPQPYKGMLSFIDTDKDVYSIGEPVKIRLVIINVEDEYKYERIVLPPIFMIFSCTHDYQIKLPKNFSSRFIRDLSVSFPIVLGPGLSFPKSYFPKEYKIHRREWDQKDADGVQVPPGDYLIIAGGEMSSYQVYKRIKIEASPNKKKSFDNRGFNNSGVPKPRDYLVTYVSANENISEIIRRGGTITFQMVAANVGDEDLILNSENYPSFICWCSTRERGTTEWIQLDKGETGTIIFKRGEVKIYTYTTSQCKSNIRWHFLNKGVILY